MRYYWSGEVKKHLHSHCKRKGIFQGTFRQQTNISPTLLQTLKTEEKAVMFRLEAASRYLTVWRKCTVLLAQQHPAVVPASHIHEVPASYMHDGTVRQHEGPDEGCSNFKSKVVCFFLSNAQILLQSLFLRKLLFLHCTLSQPEASYCPTFSTLKILLKSTFCRFTSH